MRTVKSLMILLPHAIVFGCGGGGVSTSSEDNRRQSDTIVFNTDVSDVGDTRLDDQVMQDAAERHDVTWLESCEQNSDCYSGFCVETGNGSKVCAPLCFDEPCPPGWECKGVSGTGGDVIFVCFPMSSRLCKPCIYHEDCRQPGVPSKDLCVDYGPQGKFCGQDCSTTKTCPDGYECASVGSRPDSADEAWQCILMSGECQCTDEFIANGFKTTCYVSNEYGTCYGTRLCAVGGLTACDAKTPVPEECNGFDENCDGQTDEGIKPRDCSKTFGDIVCVGPEVCEGGQWVCKASEPGPEKCDGIDNDCDGVTDPEGAEGCVLYYTDEDLDGYGTGSGRCLCGSSPPYVALLFGDCDDSNANVSPSAPEACNGLDDDCDGLTDEEGANGCKDFFKDSDQDGYGVGGDKKCLCDAVFPYTALVAQDCDDNDASIRPGAPEICDGIDNDCDGLKDPEGSSGCALYYYDHDQDGFGVSENVKCLCGSMGKYSALKANDCDDNDAMINPNATEVCNNKDDDCDGLVDEAWPSKGQPCTSGIGECTRVGEWVCKADGSGIECSAQPGSPVPEVCDNKDNDCDGLTDEDLTRPCSSPCGSGTETCIAGQWVNCTAMQPKSCVNYQTCATESMCVLDCPAAPPETCNNKDDNCNGLVDENLTRPCSSMCGSGYETCVGGQWVNCTAPQPKNCLNYSNCQFEPMCVSSCPAAPPEQCNNKDDNCNGQTDENLTRQCSTMCGSGTETCVYGQWVNCTAPQPKYCFDYTTCSYKNMCVATCPSPPQEVCDNKDNDCDGLTDEDFYNDDLCTGCGDFPNQWYGPELYSCNSGSCSGTLQGRILPSGDVDYFSVYKEETNDWIVSLKGRAYLTGPTGKSYVVCACWSQNTKCDQSGTKCAVSTGSQVYVEVENGDSWGFDDAAWLDIWVYGSAASDYSCTFYNVAWSVWE